MIQYVAKGEKLKASTINSLIDAVGGPGIGSDDLQFRRTPNGTIFSNRKMNFNMDRYDVVGSLFDVRRKFDLSGNSTIELQCGRNFDTLKEILPEKADHYYFVDVNDSSTVHELSAGSWYANGSGMWYDGYVNTMISSLEESETHRLNLLFARGTEKGVKRENQKKAYVFTQALSVEQLNASEFEKLSTETCKIIATETPKELKDPLSKREIGGQLIKLWPMTDISLSSDFGIITDSEVSGLFLSSLDPYLAQYQGLSVDPETEEKVPVILSVTTYELFNFHSLSSAEEFNRLDFKDELSAYEVVCRKRFLSSENSEDSGAYVDYIPVSALMNSSDSDISSLELSSVQTKFDDTTMSEYHQMFGFEKEDSSGKIQAMAAADGSQMSLLDEETGKPLEDDKFEFVIRRHDPEKGMYVEYRNLDLSVTLSANITPVSSDTDLYNAGYTPTTEIQTQSIDSGIISADGHAIEYLKLHDFEKTDSDAIVRQSVDGSLKIYDPTTHYDTNSIQILVRKNESSGEQTLTYVKQLRPYLCISDKSAYNNCYCPDGYSYSTEDLTGNNENGTSSIIRLYNFMNKSTDAPLSGTIDSLQTYYEGNNTQVTFYNGDNPIEFLYRAWNSSGNPVLKYVNTLKVQMPQFGIGDGEGISSYLADTKNISDPRYGLVNWGMTPEDLTFTLPTDYYTDGSEGYVRSDNSNYRILVKDNDAKTLKQVNLNISCAPFIHGDADNFVSDSSNERKSIEFMEKSPTNKSFYQLYDFDSPSITQISKELLSTDYTKILEDDWSFLVRDKDGKLCYRQVAIKGMPGSGGGEVTPEDIDEIWEDIDVIHEELSALSSSLSGVSQDLSAYWKKGEDLSCTNFDAGSCTLDNSWYCNGQLTASTGFFSEGWLDIDSWASFGGDCKVGGNLSVGGSSTFDSNVTLNGSTLYCKSDATFTGLFNAGDIAADSVTVDYVDALGVSLASGGELTIGKTTLSEAQLSALLKLIS